MGVECPPVFAWSALRVAEAGAGLDFLREVYPGLQRSYDHWWEVNAVEPEGLFTGGFLGMDNLPRGEGQAQADASGWMAFFAATWRPSRPRSATRPRPIATRPTSTGSPTP